MSTQEELLTAILAELQKQNGTMPQDENQPVTTQQESKRWMPEIGKNYYYITAGIWWGSSVWSNNQYDLFRHAIGNCYQPHEQGRAIWEQITRRKYEQALWNAADWVAGKRYYAFWDTKNNDVNASSTFCAVIGNPPFATDKFAIDAHTRILGDDAERYFTGKA